MGIETFIVPANTVRGNDKVRMLLYGPPKCGKTTWVASQCPNPLLVDVEKGSVTLIGDEKLKATPVFPYHQKDRLESLIELLRTKEGDKYETVIIDTLTEWQAKLLTGVVKAAGRGMTDIQIQDYGIVGNVMRDIIVQLFEMDKHFIVTAHTQIRDYGGANKTAPAIPPKVATTVEGLFPIIAYMTKTNTPQGVKTRMQFVDTPSLIAGNRLQLPPFVENPTFNTLLDVLPKENKP